MEAARELGKLGGDEAKRRNPDQFRQMAERSAEVRGRTKKENVSVGLTPDQMVTVQDVMATEQVGKSEAVRLLIDYGRTRWDAGEV